MEKIDIRNDVRYVIGTMKNGIPHYLIRDFLKKEYRFTDNIASATKSVGKSSMCDVLRGYFLYLQDNNVLYNQEDFAILPIEVSYKIIDNDGVVVDAVGE